MDKLLEGVGYFFDNPKIRVRMLTPLVNVHGPRDLRPINFADGVVMRPITDEEFSELYNYSHIFTFSTNNFTNADFVFAQDIEIKKQVGNFGSMESGLESQLHQKILDMCIFALATFKDGGAVGCGWTRILPAQMAFGVGFGSFSLGRSEHVPPARYDLSVEEAPSLEKHAQTFERNPHPSLEVALQRLVDSARRVNDRDSIIDSLIGLESILLREIGEKDRSEVSFRFAINYAYLFPVAERKDAYKIAKDLYKLRSQIAHGGSPKQQERIKGKSMGLEEIANLSRSMLRKTITKFLGNTEHPEFLKEGYWSDRRLGL